MSDNTITFRERLENLPRHIMDGHIIPRLEEKARGDLSAYMKYVAETGELRLHALKLKFKRAFRERVMLEFMCAFAAFVLRHRKALSRASVNKLKERCLADKGIQKLLSGVVPCLDIIYGEAGATELVMKAIQNECVILSGLLKMHAPQVESQDNLLSVEHETLINRIVDLDEMLYVTLFSMWRLVPTVLPSALGRNYYRTTISSMRDLMTPFFGASMTDIYIDCMLVMPKVCLQLPKLFQGLLWIIHDNLIDIMGADSWSIECDSILWG